MSTTSSLEAQVEFTERMYEYYAEALKNARRKLSKWQEEAEERKHADTEALVLRYLHQLGYETSIYRTSTGKTNNRQRKLHVRTAHFPEGCSPIFEGENFCQTTLLYGTGAHNVLVKAAQIWENGQ